MNTSNQENKKEEAKSNFKLAQIPQPNKYQKHAADGECH